MDNYIEIVLLGILVILVYKKPLFLENIQNNKLMIAGLLLLNAFLLKRVGMSAGIIMALIIIVLVDTKETFCDSKEGFTPKIKVWKPAVFTAPCQTDLDRDIKVRSERATIESSEQLDQHTNNGFKFYQKQLY